MLKASVNRAAGAAGGGLAKAGGLPRSRHGANGGPPKGDLNPPTLAAVLGGETSYLTDKRIDTLESYISDLKGGVSGLAAVDSVSIPSLGLVRWWSSQGRRPAQPQARSQWGSSQGRPESSNS
ncbi:Uncharacterized protein Fot_50632 [Forsythia ovata]|uniref:Uncharacterized protein n=1 Tax=Forsythia ovata TaxID=205694 RepID=A0ABD1PYP7_9LAMI